jgi:hypothetical protein
MMGININDKDCNFTEMILNGTKTVETRKTHSLRPYLGKRVGIIQTGKGKAHLVGFMTIVKEVEYASDCFHLFIDDHKVPVKSKFYKTGGCFGYEVAHVVKCDPIAVDTKGIVSRRLEWSLLNRVQGKKSIDR